MTQEQTLRVAQVARMIGLRIRTIHELADAGELRCVRVGRGRHRRFQLAAIEVYCQRVGLQWRKIDMK